MAKRASDQLELTKWRSFGEDTSIQRSPNWDVNKGSREKGQGWNRQTLDITGLYMRAQESSRVLEQNLGCFFGAKNPWDQFGASSYFEMIGTCESQNGAFETPSFHDVKVKWWLVKVQASGTSRYPGEKCRCFAKNHRYYLLPRFTWKGCVQPTSEAWNYPKLLWKTSWTSSWLRFQPYSTIQI